MFLTVDTEARATYVAVSSAPVDRTAMVTDSVAVDVDAMGQPIGVEFLMLPERITNDIVGYVIERFPTLEKLRDLDAWLCASA